MTFKEIVQIEARKANKKGREEGRQELFSKLLNEGLITLEYAVQNGYKVEDNQ